MQSITRKYPFWAYVGLIAFGGMVALLAAELGLRIWTPELIVGKKIFVMDSVVNHTLRPNVQVTLKTTDAEYEVRTNSSGFRDTDFEGASTQGERIAFVGDSFVEGVGVAEESTFVRISQRALADSIGKRIRCMNFGVSGYTTILEYLQLVRVVLKYRPAAVVVNFDPTDLIDDSLYTPITDFDKNGLPLRVHPFYPLGGGVGIRALWPVKAFMQEHSYVWGVLRAASDRILARGSHAWNEVFIPLFHWTLDSSGQSSRRAFHRTERYLAMIADTLRHLDIPMILTVHPMGHQISPLEWLHGREEYGLPTGVVVRSRMYESLQSFAEAHEILYIDFSRALETHSHGDLYYPLDGHWTCRGHRVVADTLVSFLLSEIHEKHLRL